MVLGNPLAVQEALELLELLECISLIEGGVDAIKWWPNADGIFSIKSCISFFRDYQLEEVVKSNKLAAINRFWGFEVPSKIKFFLARG